MVQKTQRAGRAIFTLSGRIEQRHLLVLKELIQADTNPAHNSLDLKEVKLVNSEVIVFLASCEAVGIKLENCPPYVRMWIDTRRVLAMKHDFQQSASAAVGGALHMPVLLPQMISRRPADFRTYPDEPQRSLEAKIRLQERREERERIAREQHDTLFQESLASSHQLGTAEEAMPADSPVKRSLNRILCFIQQAIGVGRTVSRGFRLPLMMSANLEQALSNMIREFSPRGVCVQLFVTGQSKELKPDTRQAVCLIAREALSNALRHSQASLIEVEIEYQLRSLRLMIRDDGRGMDMKAVSETWHLHSGLQGMLERAKILGAGLGIWSGRGAGSEVEVTIPLSFAANALAQTTSDHNNCPLRGEALALHN